MAETIIALSELFESSEASATIGVFSSILTPTLPAP